MNNYVADSRRDFVANSPSFGSDRQWVLSVAIVLHDHNRNAGDAGLFLKKPKASDDIV